MVLLCGTYIYYIYSCPPLEIFIRDGSRHSNARVAKYDDDGGGW